MAETDYQYDVLVTGAGPSGYVAAQLGLKTACAESRHVAPSALRSYVGS